MWTMTKAKQLPSRTRKAHPLASPLGLPTVRDTRRRLVSGELSCRDVLQQHCNVISALNPELNALPTLCLERAEALMEERAACFEVRFARPLAIAGSE